MADFSRLIFVTRNFGGVSLWFPVDPGEIGIPLLVFTVSFTKEFKNRLKEWRKGVWGMECARGVRVAVLGWGYGMRG